MKPAPKKKPPSDGLRDAPPVPPARYRPMKKAPC